ncbi:MAG: LuxR C-terminal-related transcriptional regulator [Treponema sp.]|jgi:DNA-binding CsgD family transcriptional regulator|nr:LuxR C-terminal-related transcriptional regulator [Treponema sp.]
MGKLYVYIVNLFKIRDDLTLRNIRRELWPLLLAFPLAVIIGDLRYFDLKITIGRYQSYELMRFALGLGWLAVVFTPKKLIIPLLRIAAVLSAALLPVQILMPDGMDRLAVFTAFQFLNGICAACAFSLFCFELNNIERIFGLVVIQFYYGFFYIFWRVFPAVQAVCNTWGSAAVMAVILIVVFARAMQNQEESVPVDNGQTAPGAPFVIALHLVFYMIMCMLNYIEWAEHSVSSIAFGIGSFASIALIIAIHLAANRGAMYSWLLFLAFSLLGLGVLYIDSPVTRFTGSFAYGVGDGLGYIIIYYLCGGSIKRSRQLKVFRRFCLVFFIEYFVISGIFTHAFYLFKQPNINLAFAMALVLSTVSFVLMPLMQKKLFDVDWSDGLHLSDIAEYVPNLEAAEEISVKEHLNLTDREQEIFTLLLKGVPAKEIAYTLKVSFHTVDFHKRNLYRKIGVRSMQELFALYSPSGRKHG